MYHVAALDAETSEGGGEVEAVVPGLSPQGRPIGKGIGALAPGT
jgi:hypothetical protein